MRAGDTDDRLLREVLKRVATTLKGAQVPFALTGGYASWARGGPEPVHDVDFVLVADDVPQAADALDAAGLRLVDPPEDWLTKVYDGDALVDLIFSSADRPVTRERLARADELRVDSVMMPVECATDIIASKALALGEHRCDLGPLLLHARALREQIDWPLLRCECRTWPFARAFLGLCDDLGITAA
ncbi:hypothetical protein [Pseudonocardia parietis]|uniref:Nucleotidyltransferase-like protein n=1 Tax=Pseudonocardia parietis TaxID=570936 RepID=A0ABS4W781_9PSEU|nr:hypothetical protein [Pseudonocardia parietis]MBP2371783.1 hypothetical protein [Pseudonocardia parietis]